MGLEEFERFRKLAKYNHERAIEIANRELSDDLALIHKLETEKNPASGNVLPVFPPKPKIGGRGRPSKAHGAMSLVREGLQLVGSTFTRRDLISLIQKEHPSIEINAKRISGALNKLVTGGKIKLTKKAGRQPGIYETLGNEAG